MARKPTLFISTRSTNLTPSDSVNFRVHASTHHWKGELLENSYASTEVSYGGAHQTQNALDYIAKEFVAIQKESDPVKDLQLPFPTRYYQEPIILSDEDREYYDVVREATSKGWAWEERLRKDIFTGEQVPTPIGIPMRLYTWQWAQHKLGVSVQFTHFRREGESKAELLSRILETAEKAKADYRFSIPRQTLSGTLATDELATKLVFAGQHL